MCLQSIRSALKVCKSAVWAVLRLVLIPPQAGSFIERKSIAVTWHYRRADPEYGAFQARECMAELSKLMHELGHEVEVITGKANLEVRPKFVNKGEIVRNLIKNSEVPPGFVFCTGDDTTDEGGV